MHPVGAFLKVPLAFKLNHSFIDPKNHQQEKYLFKELELLVTEENGKENQNGGKITVFFREFPNQRKQ